jgi:membrane-bound lytic murein transglycosylase D
MNSMNKLLCFKTLTLFLASLLAGSVNQALASTSEQSTFWPELRSEFQIVPMEHRRLRPHRLWYLRHTDYLDRVFDRATPYLWYIRIEVLRRGLPGEIALLPVVESAYNPAANSPGKAAGLWQIIPTTAKRFGLARNRYYDGRRDLVESTRAALDYLEFLHRRFKGDWLLALAAYNSGEGTVSKALQKNRKAGKATDFWHLELPKETRDYVPNLLALCGLLSEPEKHAIALPPIPNHPYFDIVDPETRFSLSEAAKISKTTLEQLQILNPGLKKDKTPPNGPHRILVPVENSDRLILALEGRPKPLVTVAVNATTGESWVTHKVRAGETLSHIAAQYNSTVTAIQDANDLDSDLIRISFRLKVPSLDSDIEYVVRSGDTLWELAKRYNVSVTDLRRWNDLRKGRYLRPGQRLKLHVDARRATPQASNT